MANAPEAASEGDGDYLTTSTGGRLSRRFKPQGQPASTTAPGSRHQWQDSADVSISGSGAGPGAAHGGLPDDDPSIHTRPSTRFAVAAGAVLLCCTCFCYRHCIVSAASAHCKLICLYDVWQDRPSVKVYGWTACQSRQSVPASCTEWEPYQVLRQLPMSINAVNTIADWLRSHGAAAL